MHKHEFVLSTVSFALAAIAAVLMVTMLSVGTAFAVGSGSIKIDTAATYTEYLVQDENVSIYTNNEIASATSSNPDIISFVRSDILPGSNPVAYFSTKSAGTATITVNGKDGSSDSIEVSVYKKYRSTTYYSVVADNSLSAPTLNKVWGNSSSIYADFSETGDSCYGYEIWYSPDPDFADSDVRICPSGTKSSLVHDEGPVVNSTYYVKVRAINFGDDSYSVGPWSNTVSSKVNGYYHQGENAAQYSYEIYKLNSNDIYAGLTMPIYIKTDNPDPDSIEIMTPWDQKPRLFGGSSVYKDIEYEGSQSSSQSLRKVEGGYVAELRLDDAGANEIQIWEGDEYHYALGLTAVIDVHDSHIETINWMRSVISRCTNSSMDSFEKMSAVSNYLLYTLNFKYYTGTSSGQYLRLASVPNSPYFKSRRWDSMSSPAALCSFAKIIGGFDDIHNCYSDYPYGSSGWNNMHYRCRVTKDGVTRYYHACPETSSGVVSNYAMIDFSNLPASYRIDATAGPSAGDNAQLLAAINRAKEEREKPIVSWTGADVPVNKIWVSKTDLAALDYAIDAAQKVVDNDLALQTTIDKQLQRLNTSIDKFINAQTYGRMVVSRAIPIGSTPRCTYNGLPQCPQAPGLYTRIWDSDADCYVETTLVEGRDYTVSYANNIEAGEGQIIYTGIGDYGETKTLSFTISKEQLTARYLGETIYEGQTPALKVEVTGFVNGETAETAEGYVAPIMSMPGDLTEGCYYIRPEGGSAKNYYFDLVADNLIIKPATDSDSGSDVPSNTTPDINDDEEAGSGNHNSGDANSTGGNDEDASENDGSNKGESSSNEASNGGGFDGNDKASEDGIPGHKDEEGSGNNGNDGNSGNNGGDNNGGNNGGDDGSDTSVSLERVFGNEAPETADAIAAKAFTSSEWVIIAQSQDFADAMSASGLAGALDAPILLADPQAGLSDETLAQIRSFGATKAYVIGGPNAIKADVAGQLSSIGITNITDDGWDGSNSAWRIWGMEAADTSVVCANKIAANGGSAEYAVVAMSDNFQDALSMSSFAYAYKVPIILETSGVTSADRQLPEGAAGILANASKTVFVAGGPGALSEDSLAGIGNTYRLWGYNGFDTSNQIANYMVGQGLLSAETVCVASGASNPKGLDALAGAALAGKSKGVMLLANTRGDFDAEGTVSTVTIEGTDSQGASAFLSTNAASVKHAYVLGGGAVMPDDLFAHIKDTLAQPV